MAPRHMRARTHERYSATAKQRASPPLFPQATRPQKSGLAAAALQKNQKIFTNTLAVFSRSA